MFCSLVLDFFTTRRMVKNMFFILSAGPEEETGICKAPRPAHFALNLLFLCNTEGGEAAF